MIGYGFKDWWRFAEAAIGDKSPTVIAEEAFKKGMESKGRYEIYDPNTHTAILAVDRRRKEDLDWAKIIGTEVLEEIEMPVDMCFDFFHVKLPEWLKAREENDDGLGFDPDVKVLDFEDEKDRLRFRITWSPYARFSCFHSLQHRRYLSG